MALNDVFTLKNMPIVYKYWYSSQGLLNVNQWILIKEIRWWWTLITENVPCAVPDEFSPHPISVTSF
jgi:hypothetical protein